MDMHENISEKINRLYSNRFLGANEIRALEKWLNEAQADSQMEQWLNFNWEESINTDIEISFEEIRQRIEQRKQQIKVRQIRRWTELLQKATAILILPLLILSVWLMLNRQANEKPLTMALATAKGEHSHVFLPDGSEVWLNVDSKLEYATDFNTTNRSLKLKGEALFKVAKNKKIPFIVSARDLQVTAVGTEFNISAYDDEPEASTFLKEGIIDFCYAPKGKKKESFRMNPGKMAIIDRKEVSVKVTDIATDNAIRWTKGELFFNNEPIDQVFRKMERWYNIKIHYKPEDFVNESLTVNLKNGESVGRLLEIMNEAIGIQIKQDRDEYIITRK